MLVCTPKKKKASVVRYGTTLWKKISSTHTNCKFFISSSHGDTYSPLLPGLPWAPPIDGQYTWQASRPTSIACMPSFLGRSCHPLIDSLSLTPCFKSRVLAGRLRRAKSKRQVIPSPDFQSMVSGLQYDASIAKLKLLELERAVSVDVRKLILITLTPCQRRTTH